jgi:hypothetical protein
MGWRLWLILSSPIAIASFDVTNHSHIAILLSVTELLLCVSFVELRFQYSHAPSSERLFERLVWRLEVEEMLYLYIGIIAC